MLYGNAVPGEMVTVVRQTPNKNNDTFVVQADAESFFIVQLDPDYFAASQNNLTFYIFGSVSTNLITIRDAAYGDVFLCSCVEGRCFLLHDNCV